MSQEQADEFAKNQDTNQLNLLLEKDIYPSSECLNELFRLKSYWYGSLGIWYRTNRNSKQFYEHYKLLKVLLFNE